MKYKLDDKYGLPWTAHLGLGWIVLALALSSGICAFFLAIYLSLWMYQRARSRLPLISFGTSAALSLALLLPWHTPLVSVFATLVSLLWIVGSFSLRHEVLQDAHASGFEREIGSIKTLFFSVVYINYCLNPDIFTHSTESGPLALNLRK